MPILSVVPATEQRFQERLAERKKNLALIQKREILKIATNTPELVAKRLDRLHADPARVKQLEGEGLQFDPQGPGRTPQDFPRALERVLNTNDLMGLRFFEQGLRVARAVARLHIRGERGEAIGYGTGFLVSPRLLLTNQHVLPTAGHAKRSLVEFNYQESASGEMQDSEVFALAPSQLFLCDAELDYALVAVAAEPGLAAYGWLPLIADLGKLLVGETVNIIQHPNGEPKQLAIRNNKVVDELEHFLHYQTDTDPGSSGSPVFNDQWEVVALHRSGVPKRNSKGEVLASDGRLWQEWMGEQHIAWEANEGVRVSRLVRHIREQELRPEEEPLREELLEAVPPPLELEPQRPLPGEVWLPEEEAPGATPGPVPIASRPAGPSATGATTWTIPLQVSVSVGTPVQDVVAAPSGPAPVSVPTQGGGEGQERWLLFGQRPQQPPPPPAPPVTNADFRLDSLSNPDFDWLTALSLCLASQLAYSPAEAVTAQALNWGFSDCVFVEEQAAQGFVAWTEDVVMVTFRGTESTADWLSNLHVTTRTIKGVGPVHAGFLGQFQALQPELEGLLNARPEVPLLVTGHSLGGGIAVLAATTWAGTRPVRALYTYGQPAVAKDNAAATIGTALSGRYHRLVNDADIVPRVPPTYRHAGHLLHFDAQGRVTSKETTPRPRPAGARSAAGEEAALEADDTMLSEADFQALQLQLQSGATTRGQERGLGLISNHMLPGYLSKIRQQMG
ncbi:MAG: trypsin-like peptidase domain-containing protein [Cyanobacteriota bacterium]|jgi:V8-like Glu-specific endopeptidase